MGSEHYCLRWNNHQSNLLGVFSQLLHDESLVDVTLACSEGASIRAHKVVLSACSSYFQSLFVDHPSRHPIVILKDVRFAELRTLVEFMYKGEVNVEYCQLSALLKTAESLKVKGLAEMTELRATGELATSAGATVERMDESVPQDLRAPEPPLAPEPCLERTPSSPDHNLQSINCGQNDNMGINMSISSNKNGSSRGALCSPSGELRLAALSSLAAPPPARHSSPPVPLLPARHEPVAGPSGMPPVQQVPLSLKKEVEWDRMPDDKNVGESSTDYRIPHETICTDTACTSGISGGISARDSAPLAIWSPLLAFHACRLRRYLSDDCLGYEATHVAAERRRCAVCLAAFPSAWLLERHAALQHASQTSCEDKPFVCEQCGQSYRYRSAYVKHREQNHRARLPADKLFTCDVCGMQFRYLKSFKKHRLNHALERLHTKSAEIRPEGIEQVSSTNESIVGQCGEMDLSIRRLKRRADGVDVSNIKSEAMDHAADSEQDNTVDSNDLTRGEAISKNTSYNTDGITPDIKLRDPEIDSIPTDESRRRVPVSFASVSSMADSSENESSRVDSSGAITDAASSSRLGLLGFLQSSDVDRQRERERRFACPFCGKCVRSKENLKLHVRKHTGERPFVCLFCGRAFGGKSDLTRHLRIHTGERPYHCEACGKCFARADYLSKHLTTHVHNAR